MMNHWKKPGFFLETAYILLVELVFLNNLQNITSRELKIDYLNRTYITWYLVNDL